MINRGNKSILLIPLTNTLTPKMNISMKTLIILSISIGFVLLTSLTIPGKMQSMSLPGIIDYNYKPSLHKVLWENCDLYYIDISCLGEIAPDTNIGVYGNHYLHSSERRVHRLFLFDTDIRIVDAHSIFISRNQNTGTARITNYEGTVTIHNDKRSTELGINETLLVDRDGKFEKFINEFASADSLWLTAGEIGLNNLDIPTLINRMAINFGCKVQYNYQPSDKRIVNAPDIHFDCKSGSLLDGLQLLQTIATGSQKFSYWVDKGIIYIEKYSS